MKKTDYSSWRRLERVIESSGLTINSFARYVGLPRGENLYQIKRGNYGVSLGVAKKIHAKFPQYPISWLMHGEAESAATPEGDAFVVRIPVYRDSSVAEFPPKEVPERYLLLSAEEARGGSNCIMHGRSIRNGFAALARVAAGAGRRSYKRESLFRYDGVFLSVLFRLSYRGGSCSSAVEIFVCNCRRRPGGPMRRDLCDVAGLWGYLRIKIDS
ncbi:helix-turn-helix domain-containing protein [Alistipes putredinis]|uniref:helix-turn-helix domain-containing protein n=1 Tax=Alistipes putredinis TaxID=28117 RepID=UPI00033F21F3|nr:helix-turn-helix transcriptional regulator [Alistipes putredinis]CDE65753.1 uncharacterized protein BN752_00039 [Alistipes putredinis CAG:67]